MSAPVQGVVSVTRHAEQRFLERVDPGEAYPRSRIRDEFAESEPVDLGPDFEDETFRHPESGVVYVFDRADTEIISCLLPDGWQLTDALTRGDLR